MKKLLICTILLALMSVTVKAQHRWFPPSELYSYGVLALTSDKDNNIWAVVANPSSGKTRYAIQKFDNQKWVTYSTVDFGYMLTELDELKDITSDSENNIIVGGKNNFLLFNQSEQKWKKIEFSDSLDERTFSHLFTDSRGKVWSTGMGYNVLKRDTVNGVPFTKVEPYHEIFRLEGDKLIKLDHKAPSSLALLTEASEDTEGNIWVAYQKSSGEPGGLLKNDGLSSTFDIVNTPSGSQIGENLQVRTLYIDKLSNTLYIGSQRKYQNNSFLPSMLSVLSIPVNNYINYQLPDSINVISKIIRYKEKTFIAAAGEQGGGLYQAKGENLTKIDFKKYFPEFTPWGYLGAPNDIEIVGDKMWCATSDGIVVLDMNLITSVEENPSATVFKNIYPNPARNGEAITALISLKDNESILEAFVTNTIGQNVMTIANTAQVKVPTQELASGMYFLHVKTTQGKTFLPFVVE